MISQDTSHRRTATLGNELDLGEILKKSLVTKNAQSLLARARIFERVGPDIERDGKGPGETKIAQAEPFFDFSTPSMRIVMDTIQCSAKTDASVLITGESGTGKSVAAKSVHANSHLAARPFVTVSCPSLSKDLLESTLFGHARGAFTGAICDRWGKVRDASGGTLFLDDVGDLPMDIQPKLLRLLQEGEYERVGETVTRHSGVRVIAATNHDLKKRISEGMFREDLYYRLNVIAFRMPALRERGVDLMGLAEFYRRHFAGIYGRPAQGFGEEAAAAIRLYSWPGNLRELRNAIECAVVMSSGSLISASWLPTDVRLNNSDSDSRDTASSPEAGSLISIQRLQEFHIRRVIERTPNISVAAEVLGVNAATLYRKRKRFGIE
jgi:NtrC-family two-component system response regulator AlgB